MKDYKIYFFFAKVLQLIMNDNEGAEVFISKMRSIIQVNKMQQQTQAFKQNNGSSNNDYSEAGKNIEQTLASTQGLLIVDAQRNN